MLVRSTKLALLSSAILLLGSTIAAPVFAQPTETSSASSGGRDFVDGIAAIVDDQVITLRQVDQEASIIAKQMRAQNVPMPPPEVLRVQVLNRMIDEVLQQQQAQQIGVKVSDEEVQNAVAQVAQRNNLSQAQLQAEVERSGVTWSDYLRTLRQDLLMDYLRQQFVDSRININEAEVEALLRSQGGSGQSDADAPIAAPEQLELAQILIRVPEGADRSTISRLQDKAQRLAQQLKTGEDFAGLAAANSDGSEALEGGVLGVRPLDAWPEVFAEAVQTLSPGEVSDVVRSGAGFHILKVLNRGQSSARPSLMSAGGNGQEESMVVTQTHARHILIKLSQIRNDEQAVDRLNQVRSRLQQGESFEQLAKSFSEDSSAPQGGDLGWLNPGETVPAFEQAMDSLEIGEVSEPIRSPFGWHLIMVEERRQENMANEYRRMQARQHLYQQRIEPAIEDWMSELRGMAYIDNRLEKALRAQQQD